MPSFDADAIRLRVPEFRTSHIFVATLRPAASIHSSNLNQPIKPTPDPIPAQFIDPAVRAAILEAFARELLRDTEIGEKGIEEPAVEMDLPEDGYRPVNRMAGHV